MPPKRQAQVSVVELQQEHSQDQESTNKRANSPNGNEQHQQQLQHPGLNVNCKQSMNLPPPQPPQDGDPIITQFKSRGGQWELNDENINRIDPRTGKTILHNYCQRINTTPLEVYRYLIETKGCDVNAQDNNQDTPLHYAIIYFSPNNGGEITVLTYLINQTKVHVNTKGQCGYTLLHYACNKINYLPLDVYKLLIEIQGFDVNVQNNDNHTPLHNALRDFDPSHGGNITVLTYLLSQEGVKINFKGYYGKTLLHSACEEINRLPIDVFKLLIETMGYDVNAQDNNNGTPLHYALGYFNPRNGGDITALMYLLGHENVNVNTKGWNGYTLLHEACKYINNLPLDVFQFLIETLGCDINAQNKDKDTPLHRALVRFNPHNGGDITVLMYLLTQKGVNGDTKGQYGYTLLHYACENINALPLDVFKLLIETHGGDVNAQNNDNHTPIHLALFYFDPSHGGNITVLAYLLSQKDINGNIKRKDGYTLLHMACKKVRKLSVDVFKLLIETIGCDINVLDSDDNTPLHLAFRRLDPNNDNNIAVFAYLINQNNFNINTKNKYGRTFLHLACKWDISPFNDVSDSEDDFSDPDDDWDVLKAKSDTVLSQIVEMIAERCIQQVLDETT
jgi:ankyrin repeat protein